MKNIIISLISIAVSVLTGTVNAQLELTADVYASYFGGSAGEHNVYIAVDNSGNVILAGHTYSSNLPIRSAYQNNNELGPCDAFIAKFNPNMSKLVFSTYFGGSLYDEIKEVAVDSAGNIYATGITESQDLPVTENAFDTTHNGALDAFLIKMSPDGELLYSTYLGGENGDYGLGLAVVSASRICLVGSTSSSDFPVQSAYSNSNGGEDDIFLSVLDLSGNDLIFSTYFGGKSDELPKDIKIDSPGDIYICGYTKSSDFPAKNAFNAEYGAKQDGFIAKFSRNGALVYASFLSGNQNDCISGIDINENHEVYFIGNSNTSGLVCSAKAFFASKNNNFDIILGKINATGDSLLYLSYYGGNGVDDVYDFGDDNNYHFGKIKLIGKETIVITGNTGSGNFPLSDNAYDVTLSGYDIFISVLNIAEKELIYSTLLGGSGDESANDLAVPDNSTIFISGNSEAADFPVSSDAYSKTNEGNGDEILARFKFKEAKPSTTNRYSLAEPLPVKLIIDDSTSLQTTSSAISLDFATLLGGKTEDRAHGIAADARGNVYLTAPVHSTDFPTTPNALNKEYTGIYAAKLSSTGALLFSTFLGASGGANYAHDIAVDREGCIYIAGNTTNPNFPCTAGAFQNTCKGPTDASAAHGDAFIIKLSPAGDRIIYSTLLGGTGPDICGKIAVDEEGNAYVVGCTSSNDFPVTPGAFQTVYKGGDGTGHADLFAAKLSPDGSNLMYCTYICGSGVDMYSGLTLDADGSICLVGATTSSDFPTTPGALSRSFMGSSGGSGDAFLVKLNPTGTALEYATYLGGSGDEYPRSITVNSNGNVWLAGETSSADFPTTTDAYSRQNKGGTDGFFTGIDPRDGTLLYSSLMGGGKAETMMIAVHRSGLLILAGRTESADFPVTAGSVDTISGQSDLFVVLFDPSGKSLRCSILFGGRGIDNPSALICREDHLYLAGNTTSTDFPVTTGAMFKGGTNPWGGDAFVMKFTLINKKETK